MSEHERTDAPQAAGRRRRGVRFSPKQIVGVLALVLVVIFAVQNTADTQIQFFGGELESPLWLWFLGLIVVGILIGFALPYGRKKD